MLINSNANAVSLITSISDVFGSGMVEPGTGIILRNRGADFEMDAAHANHAAPGKRVRHTIIPSMMLAPDGSLKLSFGCMGADMQPQGQVQILVNILDRGMNLQRAVDLRACESSMVVESPSSSIPIQILPTN